MKKRFTMLLLGMLLFMPVAGCNSGGEQDGNEEKSEVQESAAHEEEGASHNDVTEENEPLQTIQYNEDGTVTLPEGYSGSGFYDIDTGKIYGDRATYTTENGILRGRVLFQQNFPETRHYMFIAMVDYVQQEFIMDGEAYTEFAFDLTGDTKIEFEIELQVPDGATEFTYLFIPEPDEKEFVKDGEIQGIFLVLKYFNLYRLRIEDGTGKEGRKPEEYPDEIETVDVTGARIAYGFTLMEQDNDKLITEGYSGQQYELLISNEDGEEDKEYVIIAFLNWKQIPLVEGIETVYVKVPAGKHYMLPVIIPEAGEESVYQIYAFGSPYGKIDPDSNWGENPATYRMLVNPENNKTEEE